MGPLPGLREREGCRADPADAGFIGVSFSMAMSKRSVRSFFLFLLAVCVVLSSGKVVSADALSDLLDKLEKRREQVRTLHHVTLTTSREGDVLRKTSGRLWEKRAGESCKTRRAVSIETSQKGSKSVNRVETVTVFDGKHEWRQMPVGDKIMVFKAGVSERKGLGEVYAMMGSGRTRMKGRESIRQEPCVVLEVIGGGENDRFRATYWISESYGVVLKSTVMRADRSSTEMETLDFTANEPVKDGLFDYEPPEGATVVDTGQMGKQPGAKKP